MPAMPGDSSHAIPAAAGLAAMIVRSGAPGHHAHPHRIRNPSRGPPCPLPS